MATPTLEPVRRRGRALNYLIAFAFLSSVLFLLHIPYLDLPYFWDEMGQFVPASLDLYRDGAWVTRTALPNVHPPGLMAYLAGFWQITGHSVIATRSAMLLMSGGVLLLLLLLAIHLYRGLPGAPALVPVGLMVISPLFFTQSMMAQLDLPATLFTLAALLAFLQSRIALAAVLCTALVLMKETGLLLPAVFGAWLLWERRIRQAFYFVGPAVALGLWLVVLKSHTGHWLGNEEFAEYNLVYSAAPVRILFALLRRFLFLFVENFHWIGWLGVIYAWRKTKIFRARAWGLLAIVFLVHVVALSVVGGATLERYLLPVLPLAFLAMGAAWAIMPPRPKKWGLAALLVGMALSNFIGPPYPAPLENNLAVADFVRVHQIAARFLQENYAGRPIITAWPLTDALTRPDLGYITQPMKVERLPHFQPEALQNLHTGEDHVFVLYSRESGPAPGMFRIPYIDTIRKRFYAYSEQVTAEEISARYGLYPVFRWELRNQWVQIMADPRQFRSIPIGIESRR